VPSPPLDPIGVDTWCWIGHDGLAIFIVHIFQVKGVDVAGKIAVQELLT
jgi:hypothetical protein